MKKVLLGIIVLAVSFVVYEGYNNWPIDTKTDKTIWYSDQIEIYTGATRFVRHGSESNITHSINAIKVSDIDIKASQIIMEFQDEGQTKLVEEITHQTRRNGEVFTQVWYRLYVCPDSLCSIMM